MFSDSLLSSIFPDFFFPQLVYIQLIVVTAIKHVFGLLLPSPQT